MERGFIKIFRKLSDNPLWNKKPFSDGQAWVDLLMIANHKAGVIDKRGLRVKVERGQVGYSTKGLADRWGWSRGKVDRFLKYLENEHQIEQQKSNVTTLITLTNYEQYNTSGHQNGPQTDTKRTAAGHQTDTNKKEKKGKKEKKKEPSQRKFTDNDLKCAEYIFSLILVLNDKSKKPDYDKWSETVRKIREIDGHDHRTICQVFKWANADDFWKSNILSPEKLRKQFTPLQIKMNQGGSTHNISAGDILDEMLERIDDGQNSAVQIDNH